MEPERWRRIEDLYHSALEVAEDQRATFVKQACAGDDALREEVESLLAYQKPAQDFIEAPAFEMAARLMAQDKASSPEGDPVFVGRTISHYRVLEKLGSGGMGVVYKAEDARLHRSVALKFLPDEVARDPQALARFQREAQAASALNHPNICTIHEIDYADGITFIAMEFVAGKTLDRLIPRHGLRLNEALKYLVQIADALAAAHKAGIVHRDLKPSNVMMTEQGLVKVLDFGVAKLTESTEPDEDEATRTLKPTTEEGVIVGTVSYMSPEQAEGRKVDARSDIFSFGALLYEMVTGRRAFQGDSQLSTLTAILREEPKPAGQVVEGLPRELERIIGRCLRKSPERRFQAVPDLKVALEELKDESDSGTLGAATAPQRRQRRRLAWTAALLTVVGVFGALWFVRSTVKAPEPTLTAVPLTTYPGFQQEPGFSPDGNQVAFSWDGEKRDNLDIYVKLIDTSGSPLRLTTNPAADYCPSWSPDGRFIAFLRKVSQEKSAVLLIPALGGPERKLAEIFNADFNASAERRLEIQPGGLAAGQNLTWSPDGNSLVISDRDSRREPFALYLLSIETGEKRKLTSPPAQLVGDTSPAFSPDGRTLAFSRRIDYGLGDLYLLAFSDGLRPTGDAKRITFENRGATSPAWTADGHEIVFSAPGGLWRIAASGFTGRTVKPQRLASFGENVIKPVISRRGQRLAYSHLFFNSNIWRLAAPALDGSPSVRDAKSLKPVNSVAPFISSTRDDSAPQFAPDSKRIAFISARSGNDEIWVCDSDGSNSVQLTSFRGPAVTTPRWSPDGARVAFDSNAAGEYDIWVVGANGGKPQRMTTDPSNDGNPSWSRDGRWIYFDSARTGKQQVWKIPANGGEAIPVTRDGGFAPLEAPDGKFLYYVTSLTETNLWKIPVQGGQATKVLEGLSNYLNLAIVDSGVYFVPSRNTAAGSSLQFLSFATNKVRPVANFEKPLDLNSQGGLAASPDGRWILYTQVDQAGSELMLVENFR
jgi:Tol biopolymer transport system component/predicted Ser/Thr protein kinase